MRFNPKARLDTSQVEVREGGGGGGLPFPVPSGGGGMKVGGGIGGLLILLVVFVVSQLMTGGGGGTGGSPFPFPLPQAPDQSAVDKGTVTGLPQCRTGQDAADNESCQLVADVNSIQAFWSAALPQMKHVDYTAAKAIFFSGQTSSQCGPATAAVGPFYCPVDKQVYLDRTFFKDMLEGQLGARGGPFSESYVLAHEYGHHVQDLLGLMSQKLTQGAEGGSVRLELQADCFAGIWAKYATQVRDADGNVLILDLTQDDIDRAIDAAQAVGDDRIQQRSSGRVDPEQWTHGSAAARKYWFSEGLSKGSIESCDTFDANDLHLNG
jgi:predicted metalloprotease